MLHRPAYSMLLTVLLMAMSPFLMGQEGCGQVPLPGAAPSENEPSPAGQAAPPPTFHVQVSITGEGEVVLEPPGGVYDVGIEVQLTPVPSEGWEFGWWEGDFSGTEPVLVATGSASLIAVFQPIPDIDGDGIRDEQDNCPAESNTDQSDTDSDGLGDVCEPDSDQDGVIDDVDNCPLDANPDQRDGNGDGVGDACTLDFDGDGIPDESDNCIFTPNPDQTDSDGDGIGDACEIVVPPPWTLTVAAIYGWDVIELSDGSVWEVTLGSLIGWYPGDRVAVDGSTIINVDAGDDVWASYLGPVLGYSSVWQVLESGRYVQLLDGSYWEIGWLDQLETWLWLTGSGVVVVEDSSGWLTSAYYLIHTSDGDVVSATFLGY